VSQDGTLGRLLRLKLELPIKKAYHTLGRE
jgi:hypothetical protein